MEHGRLIRVSKFSGDSSAVSYIVAEPETARAINIIRTKIANPDDVIEDLGRVSDALLLALKLQVGDIVRA
jgi:hypothetical protein